MNPTTNSTLRPNATAALRNGFLKTLAEPLAEVEKLLQTELRSDTVFVDDLLTYVSRLGGKRLRPAILLLTAQATGRMTQEHIVLAAVVEMIHMATLIHDDILDEADTRRHRQTVNHRWNNESSVLLGDYLFTHAFYLASTLETTYACRTIGASTNSVCAGELQQVGNRGNLELGETEYYEIINGKTAELCGCATHLGAHYAGAGDLVSHEMREYGRELGIAFQIADDLLDLTGDESHTGKSLGTDLQQQKLTLPVIHLLEHARHDERMAVRQLLEQPLGDASHEELLRLLDRHGSLEYARQSAVAYSDAAIRRLNSVGDSRAKESLTHLATFAVTRSH